jgi:hypothetical protein
VCRIAGLGKFRFEQAKRARDVKKNQHVSQVNEVRLRPGIDEHDVRVRARAARRFLEDGHKSRLRCASAAAKQRIPRSLEPALRASLQGLPISPASSGRHPWRVEPCSPSSPAGTPSTTLRRHAQSPAQPGSQDERRPPARSAEARRPPGHACLVRLGQTCCARTARIARSHCARNYRSRTVSRTQRQLPIA